MIPMLLCFADGLSWIKNTFGVLLVWGRFFSLAFPSPRGLCLWLRRQPEYLFCLIFSPTNRIVLQPPMPIPVRPLCLKTFQKRFLCSNPDPLPVLYPINNLYCSCPKIQDFLSYAVCKRNRESLLIEGRLFLFLHIFVLCNPKSLNGFSLNLRLQSLQSADKCFCNTKQVFSYIPLDTLCLRLS